MTGYGFLAVGVGAVFGSWLRWWLQVLLNAVLPNLPLGTLAANLIGGYLMGLALGYFEHFQTLAHLPAARCRTIVGDQFFRLAER